MEEITARQRSFIMKLRETKEGTEDILSKYANIESIDKNTASQCISELMLLPDVPERKEEEKEQRTEGVEIITDGVKTKKEKNEVAEKDIRTQCRDGESIEKYNSREIGIVVPAIDEKTAIAHFQRFQRLKRSVLNENDFLYIGKDGRPTKKENAINEYITKSGWRKIALLFNLKGEILSKEKFYSKDSYGEYFGWKYHVRVTAPNGRYHDAEGVCTSRNQFFCKRKKVVGEGFEWIDTDEKNLMHTAQTCAFNRAISDIVGSGEISAEEWSE